MAGGPTDQLRCVTWNIAAINNNPFEYYLTLDGEDGYAALMLAVQALIDAPGDREPVVGEVFSPTMWAELQKAMLSLGWEGVAKVDERWASDLSKRKIVTKFLKDKELGAKRLASMPDRYTNTINCSDGHVVCRPSIINNYLSAIKDVGDWFRQWFEFMFRVEISIKNNKGDVESRRVCTLLQPIKRAKYPALTEEEETISLPLQLLCLAIFDAILVYIICRAAVRERRVPIDWYGIKARICKSLVVNKQENVIRVLKSRPEYFEADAIFLQEVAGTFVDLLERELGREFLVLVPTAADYVRDQNSVILLRRERLAEGTPIECNVHVAGDVPVADGDICAFAVPLLVGGCQRQVLLASFHGDTAGLASTSVVNAVRRCAADAGIPLLFGMDANTHRREDPSGATKYVGSFLQDLQEGVHPVAHTWEGEPASWITTCNARSYLQPQLNKAVPYAERLTSKATDRNPKDFILFSEGAFRVLVPAQRDNTGGCSFKDGIDLPTLEFPSDHAVVWSTLAMEPAAAS